MPTITSPSLEDVQEKFLLFQECVIAWVTELNADIHSLKTHGSNKGVRQKSSRVIPFPGNGGKPHDIA